MAIIAAISTDYPNKLVPMLLTITSILAFLVVVNFLLLIFSCNKTTKRKVVSKTKKVPVFTSRRIDDENGLELAPTGS